MPYDQFTIEQIAGDMLPHATQSQIIATGFNRNHMINFEGGAIPEEYQNEYIVDRIEATSTTWLGVTLGCARCHDHKYDPLRQKDFYAFGAFFNSVPEQGLDGYSGNAFPFLQLPDKKQAEMKTALLKAIKEKDDEIWAAESAWEQHERQSSTSDIRSGLVAEYSFNDSLSNELKPASSGKVVNGKLTYADARVGRAAELSEEPQLSFGNAGALNSSSPFSISLWVQPKGPSGMTVLQRYEISPKTGAGYELAIDYCKKDTCDVIVRLRNSGPESGIEVKSKEGLAFSKWNHLTISYDGSGRAKGIQVFLDGRNVGTSVVLDKLPATSFDKGELQIGNKEWGTPFKGELADLRFYDRRIYAEEANELGLSNPLHTVLEIPKDRRTPEQTAWLRQYFAKEAGNPAEKQLAIDYTSLELGLKQLNGEIPSTMVMTEAEKVRGAETARPEEFGDHGDAGAGAAKTAAVLPVDRETHSDLVMAGFDEPRETYVLRRGDYRNRGDKVEPNTPAVLPPLPKDAPRNRLTLAKWLVDPGNPLTARVAVNHLWQMVFGIGIVKTSEDFGSQGDPPSNQELLDWLATEFIRTKWNVKAIERLIVTSALYRQVSKVTPEMLERDPENRLLARGPRFRLPAEMVRDNALEVSGLINSKIGGKSVSPYQPKGLWEEMAFGG
ncbi:MAG: DUF1553 domain-containing protein, partial [Acidobacteriales bacterium]|nr:DUF1553 domain-containing protein [Terriglobales bacterium]